MRMKCTFFLKIIAAVLYFSIWLNGMATGWENSPNGIYMKVSGKVIQKETAQGIPGIQILLYEIISGEKYFAVTNEQGIFVVRMVPPGIYQISDTFVNMSCPEELIVAEMPETITVITGRNVIDQKITLEKGATISGCVYAADGVTPLKDVEISAEPWIYGRGEPVYTDSQGKYILKGLVDGEKLVHASTQGFEHESLNLEISPGEIYENKNFILGKGKVSVKGKVVSGIDNSVVSNALIFFIYQYLDQKYSAGYTKSNDNGEYSITGLKYPGTFELSIVHEEYDEDDKYILLESGENIINLNLVSKYPLAMTKYTKKTAKVPNKANTKNCDCIPIYKDHDYEQIQNEMCNQLNENGDCVGDSITLDCLKYRCLERNYIIKCVKDCRPGESARAYDYFLNIRNNDYGEMELCTNNRTHTTDEIKRAIFHELFHMCDRGATKKRVSCAEWRDYRATYCIFRYYKDKEYKKKFKIMCKECLLKGKNCVGK